MSVNKVILVGNLGKDPVVNTAPSGDKVANFSVATSESFKDRNGERQTRTEWHNIVVWRQLAEICEKYLHKGKQVYLEGKLQTRKWTDSNSIDRYTTEIVCHEMQMLGKAETQKHTAQAQRSNGYAQQQGSGYNQQPQHHQNSGRYSQQQPHTQQQPQHQQYNNAGQHPAQQQVNGSHMPQQNHQGYAPQGDFPL